MAKYNWLKHRKNEKGQNCKTWYDDHGNMHISMQVNSSMEYIDLSHIDFRQEVSSPNMRISSASYGSEVISDMIRGQASQRDNTDAIRYLLEGLIDG